ncbi:MAG: hypothetical protein Alpg2KO_10100 [Alphaproteobacteria bacterium]
MTDLPDRPKRPRQQDHSGLWRSSSLRVAALGLTLLATCLVALVVVTNQLATRQWRDTVLNSIEADRRELQELGTTRGTLELAQRIDLKLSSNPRAGYYYLAYGQEVELAGNLRRWPDGPPVDWAPSLISITVPTRDQADGLPAVLLPVSLPDGATLFIGREVRNLALTQFRNQQTLLAILALSGISLVVGFGLAVSILRRIEDLRRTAEGIVETADLTLRIDTSDSKGEFARLGRAFNRMLARIEGLMDLALHSNDAAAHDMRTPLTRMRHRLSHLSDRLPDGPDRDETIAAIEDIDSLHRRLDALLRLSRIRSGEARNRFDTIHLSDLLEDLAETYEPVCEEKGQRLLRDWPEIGLMMLGDRDLIFQALANLTENAIRHSPQGSKLTLGGARTKDKIDLWLIDQGPGLLDYELERVMAPFAQGGSTRHRSKSGNHGLGLAIVSAIAELHDGQFELQNNSPGLIARLSFPIKAG